MKRREIGNLLRWLGRGDANDACAPWTHLLSLYSDSQATPQQTQRVETHLAGCARCRASLALMRATTHVAQAWTDVDMPSGLSQRLSLAMAEEARKQRVGELDASRSARRRFGLPQLAFSGAALAAAFVGFYFAENHGHPIETRPTPVIAVNPGHTQTQLPGTGGIKASKPALVAAKPPTHSHISKPIVVAKLPHEEHRTTTEEPIAAHPVEMASHGVPAAHLNVSHAVQVAIAPRPNALLRPHSRPHNSSHVLIANKAVAPTVSAPRDPGLPDDDEETTPSAPATVAAATPAASQETPVLRLASTLRGLARGTQTIQPGTDQISVTMAHTANYTGAATIVGTSIH